MAGSLTIVSLPNPLVLRISSLRLAVMLGLLSGPSPPLETASRVDPELAAIAARIGDLCSSIRGCGSPTHQYCESMDEIDMLISASTGIDISRSSPTSRMRAGPGAAVA